MTDRNIKRFQLDVQVKDSGVLMEKEHDYVRIIQDNMRSEGYVPVLDLGVWRTVDYDEKGDTFSYTLTIQGVFVGKRKAWEIEGLLSGRLLPKSIPENKLEQ